MVVTLAFSTTPYKFIQLQIAQNKTGRQTLKDNIYHIVADTSHILYCIAYRYLYSASYGISQTKALSVHFSSSKKERLNSRERDKERGVERIDERRGGGRRSQSDMPIDGKDMVRTIVVLTRGRKRSWRWEERREEAEIKGRM